MRGMQQPISYSFLLEATYSFLCPYYVVFINILIVYSEYISHVYNQKETNWVITWAAWLACICKAVIILLDLEFIRNGNLSSEPLNH
jgi:hypothetical protein